MVEKFFDKKYQMKGCDGISQNVLTRAANRLIKEYKEAISSHVPDEIKAIAEQIKQGIDSEEYEDESEFEHGGIGEKDYDRVKYTTEERAHAFWDIDECCDYVYRVTWYFFSSETYTKYIAGQTLRAASHTDIVKKVMAVKGKYRYFCTHRPPSRGVIPEGFVSYDTYSQGSRYIGEVTYNEPPTRDELNNWGLVLDKDWERIREAWLGE